MAIVPRRIPIDPKLWGRIRMLAFSRGATAAAVVEDALRAYLSKEQEREFEAAFGLPHDPGQSLDAPVPDRLGGMYAERALDAKAQELAAASKARPMTPAPKPASKPKAARRG